MQFQTLGKQKIEKFNLAYDIWLQNKVKQI